MVPGLGHWFVEPDVDRPEAGSPDERSRLVRHSAGFDDDPDEIVGHEHERVDQSGEMMSLKGPNVGRSDGD